MNTRHIAFFLLISISFFSCKSQKETTEKDSQIETTIAKSDNQPSVNVQNQPQTKNKTSMEQSMIDFAFRFYKFQSEANLNSNLCVSPVSLQIALGMTYPGAKNLTAQQMNETLGFDEEINVFLKQMGAYYKTLKNYEHDTSYEFSIANRVYVEQTYQILNSFINSLYEYFGSSFEQVDFLKHAPKAEELINKWVEEQTINRIKQLIPKGLLDSSTLMVLVNAIYFKSAWKFPFEESQSKVLPFWADERDKIDVKYMTGKKEGLKYMKYAQWQVLEMPYSTSDFSFIIILPEKSTASDLHTRIPTSDDYMKMISNLRYEEIYAEIPMFRMESSYKLEEMMSDMGMPVAFTDAADFSGISGKRDIKISKILQKVFIQVNEKGSEAAAATAVVMIRTTSVAPVYKEPVRFIANHPFIFILKENTYHTPLFIGQYVGND